MSWRAESGWFFADHFSATSQAGGQADQSHEVRHAARHRHRPQIQRLQAGRVTPCPQTGDVANSRHINLPARASLASQAGQSAPQATILIAYDRPGGRSLLSGSVAASVLALPQ